MGLRFALFRYVIRNGDRFKDAFGLTAVLLANGALQKWVSNPNQ